jgi:hypothetical protein
VSSAWRQHSDPFLITIAVVAGRPKALQKLDELLAHPYFRTQIKTLVWDASTYNEYLATSYDDYKGRFGTAPHLKKYTRSYAVTLRCFLEGMARCTYREPDR